MVWFLFFCSWIMLISIFFSYIMLDFLVIIVYYFFYSSFISYLFNNKSIFWYYFIFVLYKSNFLGISYIIGIDSFSIYFILLCIFILMYCLLIYWNLKYKIIYIYFYYFFHYFYFLIYFISWFIFFLCLFWSCCCAYVFINSVWGSRSRKIYASYLFFIYTLLSSIFILFCLIIFILI
jgi:NADH:ubiquinone oxidoreductase subunit 4 (subunit M)